MLFRVLVFLLSVIVSGCSVRLAYSPDIILARANGDAITARDLEESFEGSHKGHGALLAGRDAVRQFLEKVIDKRLLYQEAIRIGLDRDTEIQKAVEKLKGMRAEVALFEEAVRKKIVIPEAAVIDAQERLTARFEVARVFVGDRKELDKAMARIAAGEDFREVARRVSQAPDAAKGGYLGIIQWGQLDPRLESELWRLDTGQVSRPVELHDGWNLLYVIKKAVVEKPKLEEAQSRIRNVLMQREMVRRARELFADLMFRWNGKIHHDAITEILRTPHEDKVPPARVVAQSSTGTVRLEQIRHKIDFKALRQLSDGVAERKLRALVEDELSENLLRQEALSLGYGDRPEIVRDSDKLRRDLVVDRLLTKVVFANLKASDQEAEAYWQRNPARFTEPGAVKLSLILTETEHEAEQVVSRLQAGASFAKTAREASKERMSAQLGGEFGWIVRGRSFPELEKVAFALGDGDLGIARLPAGHVIIRVEARKADRLRPFDEVKEESRKLALREKSNQTLKRWVTKLRQASAIEVDENAIHRAVSSYEEKIRERAEKDHAS